MAQRLNLTSTLPATRCTDEMREQVTEVAEAAGCDMADVIRDALSFALPSMRLSLQLITLEELDDDDVERLGLERREQPVPSAHSSTLTGSWGLVLDEA